MRRVLMGFMFVLLSANAMANSISIPDPKVIKKRTNAILDVETFKGGKFPFYFVELNKAKACTKKLRVQKKKFLASKKGKRPLLGQIKIDVSEYTFSTGEFEGQKVLKVNSCKLQLRKVSKKK